MKFWPISYLGFSPNFNPLRVPRDKKGWKTLIQRRSKSSQERRAIFRQNTFEYEWKIELKITWPAYEQNDKCRTIKVFFVKSTGDVVTSWRHSSVYSPHTKLKILQWPWSYTTNILFRRYDIFYLVVIRLYNKRKKIISRQNTKQILKQKSSQ